MIIEKDKALCKYPRLCSLLRFFIKKSCAMFAIRFSIIGISEKFHIIEINSPWKSTGINTKITIYNNLSFKTTLFKLIISLIY